MSKNYSTQYSRVVPHRSTDWAITSLTSEIRRDPVLSSVCGRNYKRRFAGFLKENKEARGKNRESAMS